MVGKLWCRVNCNHFSPSWRITKNFSRNFWRHASSLILPRKLDDTAHIFKDTVPSSTKIRSHSKMIRNSLSKLRRSQFSFRIVARPKNFTAELQTLFGKAGKCTENFSQNVFPASPYLQLWKPRGVATLRKSRRFEVGKEHSTQHHTREKWCRRRMTRCRMTR